MKPVRVEWVPCAGVVLFVINVINLCITRLRVIDLAFTRKLAALWEELAKHVFAETHAQF